tara:strand:- start:14764 stop:15546 length:783 start_codon:yes stop_codon:yes gene_type:complete
MSNTLFGKEYNNFTEIPYLNGGGGSSTEYVSDIAAVKGDINNASNYLDSSTVQKSFEDYYANGYEALDLDQLKEYIANAIVENKKLSKSELKNKINHAIKTENLHKNIKNNKFYNAALEKMVTEDIKIDNENIEKITQNLHNKTRHLEIRKYYDEKMKQQTGIIKTVIAICLVMLGITFLYKTNLLNSHIYIALIGVGLACIVIYTIGKSIDIFMRDSNKYDEYTYVKSHHYLNKGEGDYKRVDEEVDLISNKCLRVMEQ